MVDLAIPGGTVVARSAISVGIEPAHRGDLARMAGGRVLIIDYFASRRCSLVVGDLTAEFRERPAGRGYAELASVEGVRLFVEERLLPVLRDGEATLVLAGPVFARHLSVRLERPERWLDFLEEPGVLTGKRGFRMPRQWP